MEKRSSTAVPISEDILYQLAVIANRLIYACKDECDIEPQALLALLHTKHFGKPYRGEIYIPRLQLTRMLKEKFSYSDGDISKLMATLHDEGLIVRGAVSSQERVKIFGKPGGTQVIILSGKGDRKIEKFRGAVALHAEKWLAMQSKPTNVAGRRFLPFLEALAKKAVKKYDPNQDLSSESDELDIEPK